MLESIDVVYVHIRTSATVAWYREVLGLDVVREEGHWSEFSPSPKVRFALDHVGSRPSGPEGQAIVISFRVSDIHRAIDVLTQRGVSFRRQGVGAVADVGPSWVATFQDPEGHWLQLSQPKAST